MKRDSKAIVVGAGPCGSFAAFNLAKTGAGVDVHEEHVEVGVPSHCAGHLSIKGLRDLGLYPLPAGIVENVFSGALFFSPNGRQFEVRFSSPVTCVVNRSLFDKHIARLAEAAGAQYITSSRVESLIVENRVAKGILIEKMRGNERKFADIVIDAEGVSSRLLRQFGLSSLDRGMVVNGVEAEVESVKDTFSDEVEVFLGGQYAPGFYAWLIPRNDGSAKVGLASRSGNLLEFLLRLIKKHPIASQQLKHARMTKKAFHPITLGGPIPRTFGNGFLAVGDVASQVKPTTGGGIILGMNCARIAAEVADEAFDSDDFSAKHLGLYGKRCDEFSGFDMTVMLRIRKMLNRLSDERVDDLISFCSRFRIDEAFRNVDDLVLQAHGLLRAARSPRTFAVLAYFFLVYIFANP